MYMTFTLTIRIDQGHTQTLQSKIHMPLSVLAIAMFVLSVIVSEIITYEILNVLDSNRWP